MQADETRSVLLRNMRARAGTSSVVATSQYFVKLLVWGPGD